MRNLLFRLWYWYISSVDKNAEIIFMNFGYSHPDMDIKLDDSEINNKYSSQLYHKVTESSKIENKVILEIGCGRGGGLSYVNKTFSPSVAVGVDLNYKAVKFCNEFYQNEKMNFLKADAQSLPFDDSSFDFVLNVESSHRYEDMNKFLAEVQRVLKPGGYFSITDFRFDHEMEDLENQIKNSKLKIVLQEDITQNVSDALLQMSEDRKKLVRKFLPKFLYKTGDNFAGVEGTETYNFFKSGKYQYFHYLLKKSS